MNTSSVQRLLHFTGRALATFFELQPQRSIPILCLHSIGTETPRAFFSREGTPWCSPRTFETLINYIRINRTVIPLGQALNRLAGGAPFSDNPVVLTFDDGYRDNFEVAYPILRRYGITATIFLTTGLMRDNGTDGSGMSWDEARQMLRAGFTFGAHTHSHPALPKLTVAAASREIRDSKSQIEDQLATACDTFAYPFGAHDAQTRALVIDAGFKAAVTGLPGRNTRGSDPFTLRRLAVGEQTRLLDLRMQVSGAWRWHRALERRLAPRSRAIPR